MAVDLDDIFSRGDKGVIDLLDYAVRAVKPDLLFVFLVREYQWHPTAPKAVALFEIFCAAQAPARVSATALLPPDNPQLELALRPLRLNLAQIEAARAGGLPTPPMLLPAKYLFDALALHLRKKSASLRSIKRSYRPERTPVGNLPGGRMNAGQRFFVEKIWESQLRPRLVAAGFRRVGSVG